MRAIRLPVEANGAWWSISPWTGSLIRDVKEPRGASSAALVDRISDVLSRCSDPFTCGWAPEPAERLITPSESVRLGRMHERLLRISNRRFFLSVIYSSLHRPIFETTREAMSAISGLPKQRAHRTKLCLQRSLLAAKTSRSFRANGVLLIGAHLESFDMHAWIIEDASQPDHEDRDWINYRPLLALVAS